VIRRAGEADISRIVAMGRMHHEQAGNPGMFDEDATADYLRTMINGSGAVFLSDGGQIGGVLAPMWCAPSHVMAVELFWFATDGRGKALLAAFEEWAEFAGASQIVLSTVLRHDGQRVGEKLIRYGYAPQEVSFGREIP